MILIKKFNIKYFKGILGGNIIFRIMMYFKIRFVLKFGYIIFIFD